MTTALHVVRTQRDASQFEYGEFASRFKTLYDGIASADTRLTIREVVVVLLYTVSYIARQHRKLIRVAFSLLIVGDPPGVESSVHERFLCNFSFFFFV